MMEELSLATGRLSSWWDEINESEKWQDGVFYFLCAAYAVVSSVALVQLIRIQVRVPEYGWTTQKVFHFMNFIVNGVRAVEFGFHAQVFLFRPRVNVGSVTAICFTCFLIRCFVVGLSAFDAEASLEVLDHPILDLIYYMVISMQIDRYQAVPPKSTVGGRLREKSTVDDRLREKKERRRRRRRGKEEEEEGKKKEIPCARRRRWVTRALSSPSPVGDFSPARGDGASPCTGG
ncbi:hypothetical protein B296_00045746, partial [Ensete ventricosum]